MLGMNWLPHWARPVASSVLAGSLAWNAGYFTVATRGSPGIQYRRFAV